jgi:carboxylesterase
MAVKFYIHFGKAKRLDIQENGLYFPAAGEPKATVILIHGLTGTPNEMKYLAQYLSKRGYAVVCPRLANHGQPLPILKSTKWQQFYQSAREAFQQIENPSARPVFAAGLSMGALLALLLAEEFPEKISGVSCLSPTLFYDGWNVPWNHRLLPLGYFTPLHHLYYYKEEPPYGIKNEAVRRLVHEYYKKADIHDVSGLAKYGYPYFPISLFCQLRLLINHLKKKLGKITVPVQLIQAKDDDMTSVKNSEFIYNRIQSKNKELFLLYNSYHVITADQERETVALKAEEFFSKIITGNGTLAKSEKEGEEENVLAR